MARKKEESPEKENITTALTEISTTVTVEDLYNSGAIPSNLDTKEKVLAVIQQGQELGFGPMTSLSSIHVIKGRTVISAAMLGSLLKKNGYEFIYTKDFDKTEDPENPVTQVTLYWISPVLNKPMEASMTISWKEMALAGYTTKDNWGRYPKNMMRARALAYAVRSIAPEVLLGLYTDAEIVDANSGIEGKDITIDEEGNTIVVDTDYIEVES